MRSSPLGGLLALAIIALLPLQRAAAAPPTVTCDDIAKGSGPQPGKGDAQENWNAMAKVVCSSVERIRQLPAANESKAQQDEIHRLYLSAVDGGALRLRAVPSCLKQSVADGDVEARVVKIVQGFIAKNGSTLEKSPGAVRIMAIARWPEKLEGLVDAGQGEPVPVAWLFRCHSSSDCKIVDIQLTGSMSMAESIRNDLATAAHCTG